MPTPLVAQPRRYAACHPRSSDVGVSHWTGDDDRPVDTTGGAPRSRATSTRATAAQPSPSQRYPEVGPSPDRKTASLSARRCPKIAHRSARATRIEGSRAEAAASGRGRRISGIERVRCFLSSVSRSSRSSPRAAGSLRTAANAQGTVKPHVSATGRPFQFSTDPELQLSPPVTIQP